MSHIRSAVNLHLAGMDRYGWRGERSADDSTYDLSRSRTNVMQQSVLKLRLCPSISHL